MVNDPFNPPRGRRGPWLPVALTAAIWLIAGASGMLSPPALAPPDETPPPMRKVLDGLLTTDGAAAFAEALRPQTPPVTVRPETSSASPAPTTPPEAPTTTETPPVDRVAPTEPPPRPAQATTAPPERRSTSPAHPAVAPATPASPSREGTSASRPTPPPATPSPAEPVATTPPTPGGADAAPTPPRTLSTVMGEANGHLNASRWAEAETVFTEALALPRGRNAAVLFGRARARDGLGRTADAISDLDAALALDSRHPYALLLAGDIARRTRDLTRAAVHYRAYLEAWPKGRRASEIERWLKAQGG